MPRNEKSAVVIGRALKLARQERGLTQQDVALKSGMDRAYLSEVENGKRSLSVDRLLRICRTLDVPASELVSRIEAEFHPGR